MSNDIVNNQGDSITLDISNMSAEQLYIHIVELYHSTEHTLYIGNLDLVRGDYFDKKNSELKKLKKENLKLKNDLENYSKRDESRMRDILELKNTINAYKRYYGDYTSPFDVLKALFRGDKNKEYLDTLSILNPKKDLGFNSKSVEHWLSVFEELGIIKRIDRGRYMSLLSIKKASHILQDFVNKV